MKVLVYSLIAQSYLAFGVASSVVFGQPIDGGDNRLTCTMRDHCKQLDEDQVWQPGTCEYLVATGQLVFDYFEYDVPEYTIGEVDEYDSGPYDYRIVDTFFCEVVECGDIPDERTVVYHWEREIKTCWEIHGSVKVDIGTSLATKLIAKLDVAVEVGVRWTDCETETEWLEIPYPWYPCKDLHLWKEKGTASVAGRVKTVGSIAHWYSAANGAKYTSECGGTKNATGTADTVRFIVFKNKYELCCDPPDGEICCGCIG